MVAASTIVASATSMDTTSVPNVERPPQHMTALSAPNITPHRRLGRIVRV